MNQKTQTPFSQQIAHLAKGTLDAELTERLTDLVKQINDNGKKGSLTLTLELKPEVGSAGEVVMIQINPSVTTKAPQPRRLASMMWPTYDGDLLRQDPDQAELDLQEVSTDTGEIKDLGDSA